MSPHPTEVPIQLAVSLAPMFQPAYAPAPSINKSIASIVRAPQSQLSRFVKNRDKRRDVNYKLKIDNIIMFKEIN